MRLCCPVLQLSEGTEGWRDLIKVTGHWFLLLSGPTLGQDNAFPALCHQLLSNFLMPPCFQLSPQAPEVVVKTVLWPEVFFMVSPSSAPLKGSCSTGKGQGNVEA